MQLVKVGDIAINMAMVTDVFFPRGWCQCLFCRRPTTKRRVPSSAHRFGNFAFVGKRRKRCSKGSKSRLST